MVAAPLPPALFPLAFSSVEDSIAGGYACRSACACTGREAHPGAVARASRRWLAGAGLAATEPFAVEMAISAFDRRTAALRALTGRPILPDGMTVRPLFPPRIGDECIALRADLTEDDQHFVLFRVDVALGTAVVSLAGVWRWPAGSPSWLYRRAALLAAVLADGGASLDSNGAAR